MYNGVNYTDPRDEMTARALDAQELRIPYVAVPVDLLFACLAEKKVCAARTVVNGDPMKKILIEVRCEREVDQVTGKHMGMHANGRTTWE